MTADAINGSFELLGGVLIWLNVRTLWRDKMLRGVSWLPVLFFFVWGVWNLHYYPSLGQWWSFAGGVVIAVANAAWLTLALAYRHR